MSEFEMKWEIKEAKREVERLREQLERELGYLAARIERESKSSFTRLEHELTCLSARVERGFANVRELGSQAS